MNDEELKAIEARAEAADAGPWTTVNDQFSGIEHRRKAVALWSEKHDPTNRLWVVESATMATALIGGERSAKFIAAARTDVPALVAEVRRLREQLDLYTKQRDQAEADRAQLKAQIEECYQFLVDGIDKRVFLNEAAGKHMVASIRAQSLLTHFKMAANTIASQR